MKRNSSPPPTGRPFRPKDDRPGARLAHVKTPVLPSRLDTGLDWKRRRGAPVVVRPPFQSPPLRIFRKRSAKEDILAQWRTGDFESDDKALRRVGKTIGEIMPGILQKLRIEQRQSETEILQVWKNLIDPTLTTHANPTGIRNGTLFVTVDSSVWLDEIVRYRRREILQRLQSAFGPQLIQRISFRVG